MHIEIHVPNKNAPAKGIKLASGVMQRPAGKDYIIFYKPLTVQDGLCNLAGILNSEAIRNFISTALPGGNITLAIYNDDSDPLQHPVDVNRSALPYTVFVPNKAYRITA